jgi:hypothetical protein
VIGNDARLRQKRDAAWAFAGENQQRFSGSGR